MKNDSTLINAHLELKSLWRDIKTSYIKRCVTVSVAKVSDNTVPDIFSYDAPY